VHGRRRGGLDDIQGRDAGEGTEEEHGVVSTDYPIPDPDFGAGYVVAISGGMPARCNPINGPAGCRAEALERIQ
jgi:hypothetical protein